MGLLPLLLVIAWFLTRSWLTAKNVDLRLTDPA
jgi:hypothetical protein